MKTKLIKAIAAILTSIVIVFLLSSCSAEWYSPQIGMYEGVIYRFDNENKQAAITGYYLENGYIPECLYISDTVTTANLTFTITSIGDEAFVNGTWEQVSVCENIVTIGERAFAGCRGIKVIELRGSIPPAMKSNTFEDSVYKTATLIINNDIDLDNTPWANFVNVIRIKS